MSATPSCSPTKVSAALHHGRHGKGQVLRHLPQRQRCPLSAGNCDRCHKGFKPGVITFKTESGDVKFSHEFHLDMYKCADCHTKLVPLQGGCSISAWVAWNREDHAAPATTARTPSMSRPTARNATRCNVVALMGMYKRRGLWLRLFVVFTRKKRCRPQRTQNYKCSGNVFAEAHSIMLHLRLSAYSAANVSGLSGSAYPFFTCSWLERYSRQ